MKIISKPYHTVVTTLTVLDDSVDAMADAFESWLDTQIELQEAGRPQAIEMAKAEADIELEKQKVKLEKARQKLAKAKARYDNLKVA